MDPVWQNLPKDLLQEIAKFCNRRERRILGFDLDTCMRLGFPPSRLNSNFKLKLFRREESRISPDVFWSAKNDRVEGVAINRKLHGDEIQDAYGINDIRYTHYFNYLTGEVHMYPDHTYKAEDYVSDAIY
jgi:hypothetical protein